MIRLLCRIGKCCSDILAFKERIFLQNFVISGSPCNQRKDITNPQSISTDTGPTSAFTGFNSDTICKIHSFIKKPVKILGKPFRQSHYN